MRIVSLVPSWTETLIDAGLDVVGRTRFCVHPRDVVDSIPIVGGTKDINWDKVAAVHPDLIVMDREENTREMAEESPYEVFATHVRSLSDCSRDLRRLAEHLDAKSYDRGALSQDGTIAPTAQLHSIASRWDAQCRHPIRVLEALDSPEPAVSDLQVPGFLEWFSKPVEPVDQVVYLIWRDPWMTVTRDTFIGSFLEHVGWGELHRRGLASLSVRGDNRYPEIDLMRVPSTTLLLFSSEPYPFAKKRNGLPSRPGALVDGEVYSWFGTRSLRFLEENQTR